jgi:tetratricopeptide (TPR) repeat protein
MAEEAIDQFKKVLDMHPGRDQQVGSLKGIASLYFNMKKLDMAKQYHHKVAELDPNDPETYYSMGVIDWTEAYQPRMEERAKLGLKPDEPLSAKDKEQKKVCAALKEKNWQTIQDGIDNLNKALQLRPDYDDAMAYMNLMYREKADVECDDPASRAADLKSADDWVDKTMAIKKEKAAKQPGATGIVADQPAK